MNYSNCNGWNEYTGTYEGAYYAGDTAFVRAAVAGGSCGSTAAAAAAGTAGSCDETGRICDLHWQDYMVGFYVSNRYNQSAEVGTATQTADRTATASNCRRSCNNCNNCGNWNNCGNCGNCRS